MAGGRRNSRSASASKESIKAFFTKEKPEAKEKEEEKEEEATDSPSKTSDYESEPSRSVTPAGDTAREVERPEVKEVEAEKPKDAAVTTVKREIKAEQDDDDEGADIFSQDAKDGEEEEEEAEDESKVKAALQTGLLGAGIAEEERRMAAETRRLAAQEEARAKQELVKEAEEMSKQQRFDRLKKLLSKSKFYTDFLLQKMQVSSGTVCRKRSSFLNYLNVTNFILESRDTRPPWS